MDSTTNDSKNNQLIDKIAKIFKDISFQLDSSDGQTEVAHALNKTVLVGGKRLRPLFTYLFSNLVGVKDDYAKNLLCKSIEFVHAASLAHDDVIDNATLRRGEPSINLVVGNKKSILAGDFLLADVIQNLSELNNGKVLSSMAKTIKELSLGEWLQHDLLVTRKYNDTSFEDISILKTSSVLKWCVVGPMHFVGLEGDVVEEGARFGESLGVGFQLIDDVLDFQSSANKDLHLDLKNNQLTSVTYRYLKDKNLLKTFVDGEDLEKLVDVEDIGMAVSHVKAQAMRYLDQAEVHFSNITNFLEAGKLNPSKVAISYLIKQLRDRVN